jgi:hypothetical protein
VDARHGVQVSFSYLDVAGFTTRTIMPAGDVSAVESDTPGYTLSQLTEWSSRMNSVLRKRYDIPFASPYPEVVLGWLQRLVTPRVYLKRGVNPSDAQFGEVLQDAKDAWAEIKEAADSNTGLYDLPVKELTETSAVTQGGPFSYSEPSPYDWTDVQAQAVSHGFPPVPK